MFEPGYEVAPPMWRTGDLVIVKCKNDPEQAGIIVSAGREWINHVGGVWSYHTLVHGKIVKIFETRYGDYAITRRATETTEELWEKVSRASKREI